MQASLVRGGRGAGDGVMRSTQGAFHVLVLPVLFSASWAVSFEAALLVSECRGGELKAFKHYKNPRPVCMNFSSKSNRQKKEVFESTIDVHSKNL